MQNRFTHGTLASYVRNAFNNMHTEIGNNEILKKYVAHYRTIDLLNFSKADFDKAIETTAKRKIEINSKFQLIALSELATIIRGMTYPKNEQTIEETQNIILTADNITLDGRFSISKKIYLSENFRMKPEKRLLSNDIFICFASGSKKHVGKVAFIDSDQPYYAGGFMGILRPYSKKVIPYYLYSILNSDIVRKLVQESSTGANIQNLSNAIGSIKLPLPPLSIQQQIVAECQKVDEEYNSSRMSIEDYRKKIAQVFENLQVIGGGKTLKLNNLDFFEISIGRRILNSEVSPEFTIPVYSANVFEPFGMIDRLLLTDFSKDSVLWGIDGDWMVNTIPANTPFFPTDHCGVLRIKTNDVLPKYMAYLLQKEGERVGFNRSYRASIDRIESLTIEVAPIEEQRKAVSKVEQYEAEIRKAQAIMNGCAARKKAILDKYLN